MMLFEEKSYWMTTRDYVPGPALDEDLNVDVAIVSGRDAGLAWGKDMDKDRSPAIFRALEKDVRDLFPSLENVRFTHHWGGPVSITLDLAPAMGYVGDKNVVALSRAGTGACPYSIDLCLTTCRSSRGRRPIAPIRW